jgi:hypothetical protein
MTPEQLAKSIWVKSHMMGCLAARQKTLGNQIELRAEISRQIGRLSQHVARMQRKMDQLGVEE